VDRPEQLPPVRHSIAARPGSPRGHPPIEADNGRVCDALVTSDSELLQSLQDFRGDQAVARKTAARTERDTEIERPSGEPRTSTVFATTGSGKSHSVLAALGGLPVEQQRFALLLAQAMGSVADETEVSESQVRNVLYRLVQAGLLQERRAPEARAELARALGPSLADLDPVPHATVEQARRLATMRASLLREGALSTATTAEARGMTRNNARQWISRHRKAHRLFTITHEGETLVPAFLLDEELEPRPEARAAIQALRECGENGWALWAWFATPSAWLGGRVPAEVLSTDPGRVAESARQRAAASA